MSKVFIIGEGAVKNVLSYFMQGVMSEEGNRIGHPNAPSPYVDLTPDDFISMDIKYIIQGDNYPDIKSSIDNSPYNHHSSEFLFQHIPQLKIDYPDCVILVVLKSNTVMYTDVLDYLQRTDLPVTTLLTNTIIDINDDGSLNESTTNIDAISAYSGECTPWRTIDFFIV